MSGERPRIRRLVRLELENFRLFKDPEPIPLDADVVLIYGANGAGKSNLVGGLECALTGEVAELRRIEEDYPRSLRHLYGDAPVVARVTFEKPDGSTARQTVRIKEGAKPLFHGTRLAEADSRFFAERCCLSQTRLGRLLEDYQRRDPRRRDLPLIQFVNNLMGLQRFDDLRQGLRAADWRRLPRESTAIQRLEEKRRQVKKELDDFEKRGREQDQRIADLASGLKLGRRPSDLETRARRLKTELAAEKSGLRKLRDEVSAAQGVLTERRSELPAAEPGPDLEEQRRRLEAKEKEHETLQSSLAPGVREVEQRLGGLEVDLRLRASGLVERLDELREAGKAALEERREWLTEAEERTRRLARLQKDEEGMMARIAEAADGAADDDPLKLQEWAAALSAARERVVNDRCPVCGRDYSELGREGLDQRIEGQLAQIAEQLEARAGQSEARRDLAALRERIAGLRAQVAADASRLPAAREADGELTSLVNRVEVLSKEAQRLSGVAAEIAQARASAEGERERRQGRAHVRQRLAALAAKRGLQMDPEEAPEPLAERLEQHLVGQLLDLTEKENSLEEREAQVEELLALLAERRRRAGLHRELDARARTLEAARKSAGEIVTKAQAIKHAAQQANAALLQRAFDEGLNDLWRDLFTRLVPGETFTPELAAPESQMGTLVTSTRAVGEVGEPFQQLSSVLSSGNLNTAGLTLFLALHLMERPRIPVLVLDDPIQNMDDLHLVQMAGLLRSIVRDAERQLVVAVHERELFEYLRLELGPTTEQGSLLAIEVVRDPDGRTSSFHHHRHTWQGDLVAFGSARAG